MIREPGDIRASDNASVPSIKVVKEDEIAYQEPSLLQRLERLVTSLATDPLGHPLSFGKAKIGAQNAFH